MSELTLDQRIQRGDIVSVNFNNSQNTLCREAFVLHMPSAVGDTWGFLDVVTRQVHYVSEGCTVTKQIK